MSKFILKFEDVAVQPSGSDKPVVQRAVGFVSIRNLVPLLNSASLAPNPRSAKRNSTIEGILGSLEDTPSLFRYKSKGLLISSHTVQVLERKRFRLAFTKDFVDGVLDGGHNLFAIAVFLLEQATEPGKFKRIKNWDQLDEAWADYGHLVEEMEILDDIQVAVELIFPTAGDEETLDEFDHAAFDISQARNANTAVKTEAFQNKLGFYDVLKESLPKDLSGRVEWKPGVVEQGGEKPISVRDIVALAWVPLNVANEAKLLPVNIAVLPQNIYRNKGECSDKFNTLMMNEEVTQPIDGKAGQARQLIHPCVSSCLSVAADMPRLVDLIYEKFPRLYNAGGYRFGRRNVVKYYDPEKVRILKSENKDTSGYTSIKPVTPYFRRTSAEMKYKFPEALIIPFVTGLSALMEIKGGKVQWVTDDIDSLVLAKLEKAAPLFDGQLDAYDWDPQRLAKSPSSHKQAASYYKVL